MNKKDIKTIGNKMQEKYLVLCDYQNYDLGFEVINNFVESINNYDKETNVLKIINEISGVQEGAYIIGIYQSALKLAENVFEVNNSINYIKTEFFEDNFLLEEPEKNLSTIVKYILMYLLIDYLDDDFQTLVREMCKK